MAAVGIGGAGGGTGTSDFSDVFSNAGTTGGSTAFGDNGAYVYIHWFSKTEKITGHLLKGGGGGGGGGVVWQDLWKK